MLTKNKYYRLGYEVSCVVLTLLASFVMLYLVFANVGLAPFGDKNNTLLMIDAQSEYIAYFRSLKGMLNGDFTLAYTLSKVFGGNYMSLYTFYLASPLNLFVGLVDNAYIPEFMLVISLIKMMLAGLNMYLLLRFMFKKPSFGYLLFAVAYSFSSYNFLYLSNLMWLDGVMILPLVVLGIELLWARKCRVLYPLALAYGLMSSWYIGSFLCIFSALFAIYKFISQDNQKIIQDESKVITFECFKSLIRFAFLSIIGGMIALPYWGSAFIHFSGTKAGGFQLSSDELFYSISLVFTSFFEHSYQTIQNIQVYEGYASNFTSMAVLPFFLLFFFNTKYSLKERLAGLGLFFIYVLSTYISPLNILMHGGKAPTWFPTRFSFITGFIVIYFASKHYNHILDVPIYSYICPILMGIIAYLICSNIPYFDDNGYTLSYQFSLSEHLVYYGTTILLFVISLLFNYKKKALKFVSPSMVFVITLLSLTSSYLGANNILQVNLSENQFQDKETYLDDNNFQVVVDSLKRYDSNINYRLENTFIRNGNYNSIDNDPMFYSYYGLSHFSSVELYDVMNYMEKIGFHSNGFFEGYDGGSSLAMNAYAGIKYLIDDESNSSTNKPRFLSSLENITSKFDKKDLEVEGRKISIYKNPYALPLGFGVIKQGASYIGEGYYEGNNIYWYDHLEYQNNIYHSITDKVEGEIFKPIEYTILLGSGVNDVTNKDNYYHPNERYYNIPKNGSVTLNINETVPNSYLGQYNLYFGIKDTYNDYFNIYIDNRRYEMTTYWHRGIRSFPETSNKKHTIRLTNKTGRDLTNVRIQPEVYYEDLNVLSDYISQIRKSQLEDSYFETSLTSLTLNGKFTKHDDDVDEFMFSLPYEKGMQIYIDGKKVNTYKIFNVFTGCDISNLSNGSHQISIQYIEEGLTSGFIVSLLSIEILACYYFIGDVILKKREYDYLNLR